MLGDIQLRLQARFKELSEARRELDYPVYAFEHGLDREEIDALKAEASGDLRHLPPSPSHWLVWAALGAEAGYGYSGDEYWPAIEVRPGEWRTNDFRQTLRAFYRRFDTEFRGPKPVGRWADQFSIIAWPIAHSILPKYLQTHFARHLFELRHEVAHLAQGDGSQIGTFLFRRYQGSSSRFRDFLQQTDLTSQIVLALRDEGQSGHVERIEPAVLRRIVHDLEQRRDARTYLRDTRKLIHSTAIKLSSNLSATTSPTGARAVAKSSVPPRVLLAARRLAGGTFVVGIQLPDFQQVLAEAGIATSDIAGQRIRFAGDGEPLVPASTLLTLSKLERKLSRFPDASVPLVVGEDQAHPLAAAISSSLRIEERPSWVLRRQANGLYREVVGGHVRAKEDYLILTRGPIGDAEIEACGLAPIALDIQGAHGYALKVPARLGETLRASLKAIGVGTISGVLIEPVGLNPSPNLEVPSWITTEPVLLRISPDYDLAELTLAVDDAPATTVSNPGGELIVALDALEPGNHRLSVSVPTLQGAGTARLTEQFQFAIVAPRPWPEAMREKSGFRLVLDPANAELEELISRQATLQVVGPPSKTVHWSIETYDAAGHLAARGNLGTTKVGDPLATVQSLVEKMREQRSDDIDEAYQVELIASLDELGRVPLKFSRTVEPLRWKFDAKTGAVRLVDETDHSEPLTVRCYPLVDPLRRSSLDVEASISGVNVKSPGALLTARYQKLEATIFVSLPPAVRLTDLADLDVRQAFSLPEDTGSAVIKLIDGIRRWRAAKPVGHLAPLRRDTTIERLRHELAAACCGREFANLLAVQNVSLERVQAKVGGSQGFGYRMRTFEWPSDVKEAAGKFIEYARTYQVEGEPEHATHALALAYAPLSLRLSGIEDRAAYLATLLQNRTLMRGAFLARAVAAATGMAPLRESA
jgi:hypothetical protein